MVYMLKVTSGDMLLNKDVYVPTSESKVSFTTGERGERRGGADREPHKWCHLFMEKE